MNLNRQHQIDFMIFKTWHVLNSTAFIIAMKNALLGPWDATFDKDEMKAKYAITKDKDGGERIQVKSCNWKGCDKSSSASLKPSTDKRYPSSDGWFKAKSLHQPKEDLFVKNEGHKTKLVKESRLTNEKIEGDASKDLDGKDFYEKSFNFFL